MFFISNPLPFVLISRGVLHFSMTFSESLFKSPLVDCSVLEQEGTFSVLGAFLPHTSVSGLIYSTGVLPVPMSLPLVDAPLILAPIGPAQSAFSFDLVVFDLSLIGETALPGVGAFPVHESFFERAMEIVAIQEVHLPEPSEALVVYSILDDHVGVAVPLAVVLDRHLQGQVSLFFHCHL